MEECICPVLVVADTAVPVAAAEVPVADTAALEAAVIVEVPVADMADALAAWVDIPAEWVIVPVAWVDTMATWDISLPLPVQEEVGAWAADIPAVVAAAAA